MQTYFGFLREIPEACPRAEWDVLADELHAAGVPELHRIIAAAKGAGLVPDDVRRLLTEYRTISHRLDGPGAILYRLANGRWPAKRWSVDEYEMQRARLFRELRRAGKSQEEIDAEVERLLRPPPIVKPRHDRDST